MEERSEFEGSEVLVSRAVVCFERVVQIFAHPPDSQPQGLKPTLRYNLVDKTLGIAESLRFVWQQWVNRFWSGWFASS